MCLGYGDHLICLVSFEGHKVFILVLRLTGFYRCIALNQVVISFLYVLNYYIKLVNILNFLNYTCDLNSY